MNDEDDNKKVDDKTDNPLENGSEEIDDVEVAALVENHDLDKDTAEKAQELIEEEGLDEDDAVTIAEEL